MIRKLLALDFGSSWEKKLLSWGILILRVGVALFILKHGYYKLMNFSAIAPNFPDPLSVGSQISLALVVGSEFFGALFLLFGLLTRLSSFSLLFTVLMAGLVVHGADPFRGEKELAVLYGLVFLFFVLVGGRAYSLDHYLKRKLRK